MSIEDKEGKSGGQAKARTASVQAVTRVTATVLSKSDMQWAVDHDYSLESEIQSVIQKRTEELAQKK